MLAARGSPTCRSHWLIGVLVAGGGADWLAGRLLYQRPLDQAFDWNPGAAGAASVWTCSR
jgi:hypothetical protein